jgi:hypothetical protein
VTRMGRGEGRPGRATTFDQIVRGPVAEEFRPRSPGLYSAPPPGRPPAAERGPDRPGDQRQRPKAALDPRKETSHVRHEVAFCAFCLTPVDG